MNELKTPTKLSALFKMLPADAKQKLSDQLNYSRPDALSRALQNPERLPIESVQTIAKVINAHYVAVGGKHATIEELFEPVLKTAPCIAS